MKKERIGTKHAFVIAAIFFIVAIDVVDKVTRTKRTHQLNHFNVHRTELVMIRRWCICEWTEQGCNEIILILSRMSPLCFIL